MGVTASPSGYPPQTYSQAHTRLLSLTQLRNRKGDFRDDFTSFQSLTHKPTQLFPCRKRKGHTEPTHINVNNYVDKKNEYRNTYMKKNSYVCNLI